MKYIKCKMVIYALVVFSVSTVLNVFSGNDSYRDIMYRYYLCDDESKNSDIYLHSLKSYFLCGNSSYVPEFITEKKDNLPLENADIYSSDDENIVFDSQKSSGLDFNNETEYVIDNQSLLAEKPNLAFKKSEQPEILIVHTHASESYGYKRTYPLTDTDRTQDKEYNMIKVGKELKKHLENMGYSVLHDETIHDYPSYTSSYRRAGETIENHLKNYPSIVAVFDLHRDAIIDKNGKSVGLKSLQKGDECAQIMMVCGTDRNNLKFDHWEENLRFAFKIQNYMEKHYPGLMRPLNIRKERFNLHLTKGSILFEIGSNGNSLIQAINSVKYLAEGIDDAIKIINSIK